MQVLALTKYDVQAASTRQRFVQYIPYLAAHGVDVELSPLLPNNYLNALNAGHGPAHSEIWHGYLNRLKTLIRRRDYDLLWVQYELFPFLPGCVERLGGWTGKPVVCDYDDAIFHSYDSNSNGVVRALLGNKLEPLLSRASAAICGNAYLKEYAERFCPKSVVVPTVVDTSVFVPRFTPADPGRPLVVGWLGSPTTWQNVEPLLPAIMAAVRSRGATLRVIGAGSRLKSAPGMETVDWSEAAEVSELQNMDIGIMPLLDRPFQRGKCGYKLIQYMACGLPVVASPVGVNAGIVAESNGFLAPDPASWTAALGALLDNAALRARMSAEGRRIAVERYSLAVHQPRVLDILRSAVGSEAVADYPGAA